MRILLKRFWTDESGQGLAEYSVLLTMITVVLVAVVDPFRESIMGVFSVVTTVVKSVLVG